MSRTLLPLAGFEVTLNGRFWVTAEGDPAGDAADVDIPGSPYLVIQRQFEDPDGAMLKPMTKNTSGIFAYVRLSSVHLASFLKLRESARTESK